MEDKGRRFHPDFAEDLLNAVAYYDKILPSIGTRFRSEVQSKIDLIASTPEGFAFIYGNIRAVRTRNFPYVFLYRVHAEYTEFIGLVLGSTRCEQWFERGR